MSDTDSPLRIPVRPEEGLGLDVVAHDVGQELPLEIERRGEDPTSDAIPLELSEPQLHLVEPGAVGRSVEQLHAGMPGPPGLHLRGLVGREVVDNDVDLFAPIAPGGLLEEPHKLRGVVSGDALPADVAGGDLQGGVEREGATPEVLKAVPFALPRLEGQGRLRAIKGLNVTLLIDAQDDGMGGGIDIQPENGRGLCFEVGVGAGDVVVQLMGSETMAAPEPADETLRDAVPRGPGPARPPGERGRGGAPGGGGEWGGG